MTRIETTTGAHRFENKKAGLVWIGIPAKACFWNLPRKVGKMRRESVPILQALRQNAVDFISALRTR